MKKKVEYKFKISKVKGGYNYLIYGPAEIKGFTTRNRKELEASLRYSCKRLNANVFEYMTTIVNQYQQTFSEAIKRRNAKQA